MARLKGSKNSKNSVKKIEKSIKKTRIKREEKQFGLVSPDWSISDTILNQKKAYIINGGKEGFCLEKRDGLIEIEITIKEK